MSSALMSTELAMTLALLLPVAGAIAVLLARRFPNVRETITMTVTLATFASVIALVGPVRAGLRPEATLFEVLPGLPIRFEIEPLGMLYALVASGLWIVTSLYAIGYMRGHREKHQTRFFVCFALAISAALGIAFAGNLLTLFLFYELLTLVTYPLVTHHGTEKARNAGRVYLGVLMTTSIGFLLTAITWTYVATGTLDFELGGIMAGKVEGWPLVAMLALYAFGTGKAALMPFHRWLPAAMVAPTPVSALLHAVAVVKAGVFTILKVVVYIFGNDYLRASGASLWLMYAAAFTLLAASVVALAKNNLKARLAYSTISQLAYIVLGAAIATDAAVIGGGMHIAMHAMGKITLFFCAGAIYVGAHKTEVSELDGIGRTMPWTMVAFLLGSLSIIGIPPFGGAWSKWFLMLGAADAQQAIFVAVLMASSLLAIGYLMPIVARAFFAPSPPGEPKHRGHRTRRFDDAPLLCVVAPCVTAIGCLMLFVFADAVADLLRPILGGPMP